MYNQKGISAILLVVIIGVMALIFINTTAIMSVDELSSAVLSSKYSLTQSLSLSCAEEALRRIGIDNELEMNNYVLNFKKGSCIINSSISGDVSTISIVANLGDYYNNLDISGEFNNGIFNVLSRGN